MSETIYLPGQRWLSDTDPDLGLGLVTEIEPRRLTLLFPAIGESRVYALPDAPLTRLVLEPGDSLQDDQEEPLTVVEIEEREGLFIYLCRNEQGESRRLAEMDVSPHLQLNRPREKLLAGRLDSNSWFDLRQQSWQQMAAEAVSPVQGLAGPRISLIPHQLYIAWQTARRFLPRVLLADEVGLGKTIEAGLILHRMLLAGRARRVLIVVPDPLLHQWLVEMLRRFNLRFALFDKERFEASDSDNPFADEQQVLCSLDFLLSAPKIARAALEEEWDLLVVDEAHHLHWSEEESSLEYDLVEALAEQALGVLLLSATPEQLGRAGHFGRLRLLDPHRYPDYQSFLDEETRYQQVADIAARLLDDQALKPEQQDLLEQLLGDVADLDPGHIVRRLVDRFGTGRVMFRNTRHRVQGFPRRVLHVSELDWPAPYAAIEDPAQALAPERHVPGWQDCDPRLGWLAALLNELAPQKVLLICASRETVLELQEWLRLRHAIHAAVFHEDMEIVERDRAAAFFADAEEGSQILLCSEIGSEGRNFQFARHLVLFDLPLEPDLLEQRIGRLDRIGQGQFIDLHLPLMQGSPMEGLYRWYQEGLNAFEQPSAVAVTLYEEFSNLLHEALEEPALTEALLEKVVQRRVALEEKLARGRDRLLELQSCDQDKAASLVAQIEEQETDSTVADYMLRYWDAFGVEHEPGPGKSLVLKPGEHMRQERFPGLAEDGATVTFERNDALVHEDRQFLTWEHPMVRGALEELVSGDLGSAAFLVLENGPLPSGTLLLELVFVLNCAAPRELEASRYLPPTTLRLVLDRQGKDYAALLPAGKLRGRSMHRDRPTAAKVIKSQAELLRGLIVQGEQQVAKQAREVVDHALDRMRAELEEEQHRLQSLSDGSAMEELQLLEGHQALLEEYLPRTRLRLDALRLFVRV
ncbi:RNA polymerase-associated protein RapA [Thiolapillus brandeum]|uniref:RNA polymerase-associated protein RapA n=1 Tax=Thiolapillus brandeum TaxID=1076588 RepID=A0A7U6GH59_9GAMM|nr:RNA polymerase-associated protein RapA [Thiolapillus brandeum]BAO43546.1 ATP-dependent helicase HepA [Thiolapillus brandeum]